MPTTLLDGESYEQALHRRMQEEAEISESIDGKVELQQMQPIEIEMNGKRYRVSASAWNGVTGEIIEYSVKNITGWITPYLKVGSKDYLAVIAKATGAKP